MDVNPHRLRLIIEFLVRSNKKRPMSISRAVSFSGVVNITGGEAALERLQVANAVITSAQILNAYVVDSLDVSKVLTFSQQRVATENYVNALLLGYVAKASSYTFENLNITQTLTTSLLNVSGIISLNGGVIDLGNGKITGLVTPANPDDAANKQYVDLSVANFNQATKPVDLATVTALPSYTFSANTIRGSSQPLSVDGVSVTSGMRVLVKDETVAANNGVYFVVDSGTITGVFQLMRDVDFNKESQIVAGISFSVKIGSTNGQTVWFNTTTLQPGTLNSTPIQFIPQTLGSGTVSRGLLSLQLVGFQTLSYTNLTIPVNGLPVNTNSYYIFISSVAFSTKFETNTPFLGCFIGLLNAGSANVTINGTFVDAQGTISIGILLNAGQSGTFVYNGTAFQPSFNGYTFL